MPCDGDLGRKYQSSRGQDRRGQSCRMKRTKLGRRKPPKPKLRAFGKTLARLSSPLKRHGWRWYFTPLASEMKEHQGCKTQVQQNYSRKSAAGTKARFSNRPV